MKKNYNAASNVNFCKIYTTHYTLFIQHVNTLFILYLTLIQFNKQYEQERLTINNYDFFITTCAIFGKKRIIWQTKSNIKSPVGNIDSAIITSILSA